MKKIEMEFLKDFNDSLESRKTFKDIHDEINIKRFKNEPKKQLKLSFAKLGFVGVCLLLLAIIIPTTIFLFNTPKVVGLTITNKDDLVIEYQRNCNFINKGIMVDKKMSDGSTVRANEEEIIIDFNTFDNNNSGRYYISVYLKNKPEVETGYYVSVSEDEISNIELIDYRDTYYVGETIIPEDLIVKKNLSSGKTLGTKYTEYSIDTSNFNGNKVGKYDVNVVLNSNNNFTFSYEVEVKQIRELDINGRYGYIDSYYKDNAPTILALEINDNVATSYYSEIIVGETPAQTLIKEVIDGKIVIKDDKHSQKMIYKPFTNEMIVNGLMVGEPDMKLFKLDEDDYVISLNGKIADKNTFYIAKDGYLSKETISYLFNTYGGIYIDEEMEKPVTEETFFSNDSIVIVGSKNDGIDEKLYLGTFYDSKNRIALVIEEDILYSYSNTTPISYIAQLKDNGDVWIRTSPYDPIYRYISKEDKFEIYSGDNYYVGDLYRYNSETHVTITVNRNIGTSPYKFVLNKGDIFNCINIERNQLEFFKIPGYNETPIYEDTTFNNVTISYIYMSDFSYDIFGSYDNYFIIRTSYSVGKELIDGKTTYWYEIYENYDAVELGWIEFSGYKDRTIYFTLHNEDGSYKTISYNRDEKCYTIENIMFSLNETPFKDFDFVGKYIGSDGTEKIISDKGMLGTIRYTTVGNQVIDYEYIYIDTLEEDSVTLWYTYQTIEDKLEIKKIQLIKKDFGWSFEIDGVTYTQEIIEEV